MVVGMNRRPTAFVAGENFIGPGCHDLIHVHVAGGAGPGLKNIHDKLIVKATLHDFLRGVSDGRR